MTSPLVERVARALAPLAWAALGTGDTLAHENRRKASLRHARAAIEAMREPTEAMRRAVSLHGSICEHPVEAWRAGIDAALKEG